MLTEFVVLRMVVSLRDERSDVAKENYFLFGYVYYPMTWIDCPRLDLDWTKTFGFPGFLPARRCTPMQPMQPQYMLLLHEMAHAYSSLRIHAGIFYLINAIQPHLRIPSAPIPPIPLVFWSSTRHSEETFPPGPYVSKHSNKGCKTPAK